MKPKPETRRQRKALIRSYARLWACGCGEAQQRLRQGAQIAPLGRTYTVVGPRYRFDLVGHTETED